PARKNNCRMATIPPVIEAALRSPQMPPKVKIFLQGLEVLIPGELPPRSRGPVSTILSEISTDLRALAATASTSIGSARTTTIINSLSRSLRAWESQLHAAFILKPSPFDPLLAKHILIGSGSYLREVQKAREV